MDQKRNILIILVVILLIVVLGLLGFIISDKILVNNDSKNTSIENSDVDTNNSYETFRKNLENERTKKLVVAQAVIIMKWMVLEKQEKMMDITMFP